MKDLRSIPTTKSKQTITVKRLMQIITAIVVIIAAIFGYFYWKHQRPADEDYIFNMEQRPVYRFSIYGNPKRSLKSPMAAYVSRQGNIYVASTNNHEIQVFKPNGEYLFTFGRPGPKPGELAYPYGITENKKGNLLISETGNKRIQEFTPQGEFVAIKASPAGPIKVEKPGPLFAKDGKLYIGDLIKQQVIVVDDKGQTEKVIKGVNYPHGIAADGNGKVYIADAGGYRIAVVDKQGRERQSIASWQENNRFSLLRGLALDTVGRIFVADSIVSTIRVFDADGNHLFSFGNKGFDKGELLYPTGVFIDGSNRIFIADWANNRVEVWGY